MNYEKSHQISYKVINFDTSGLVRRMREDFMTVPDYKTAYGTIEGFQRNFVWKKSQMDSFIESVLLGYPTPGIFLIEPEIDEYLILDGQQRLITLYQFTEGVYKTSNSKKEQVFNLSPKNVINEFAGLTYKTLTRSQKSAFDNYLISATVIAPNKIDDNRQSIYDVFNRLNSGGTKLLPHEIRIATWAGNLPRKIHSIYCELPSWENIYGEDDDRFRDHELVSRIMAILAPDFIFNDESNINHKNQYRYKGSPSKLINDFYESYSERPDELNPAIDNFNYVCNFLSHHSTNSFNPLKPFGKINNYWSEAVFFGLSNLIKKNSTPEQMSEKFKIFCDSTLDLENKTFRVNHFDKRGSLKNNFIDRLDYASSVFTI